MTDYSVLCAAAHTKEIAPWSHGVGGEWVLIIGCMTSVIIIKYSRVLGVRTCANAQARR